MTEPFFSVIIPVYNREKTIAETLESVASQEFRDYEVIVVDDGSDDNTLQIVKQFAWVKLIEQPNSGPGAARNRGVAEARGKYVAFLDSDDLWFPWTLRNYHRAIKSFNAAFVSGEWIEFRDNGGFSVSDSKMKMTSYSDFIDASSDGLLVGMCGVAIDRMAFNKSGGFVSMKINGEDSDLWLRLGNTSPFIRINSPVSFMYRRTSNSETGSLTKSIVGGIHILKSEQQNLYPGGVSRKIARQTIISNHIRPVAVECARQGYIVEAIWFYFSIMPESVRSLRYRFLLGLPVLALYRSIRQMILKLFRVKE